MMEKLKQKLKQVLTILKKAAVFLGQLIGLLERAAKEDKKES